VFLKSIIKKYKVKPIVAGFSQGGDISFLLAIYYPDLIKAAFPLAGFVHRQRFDDVKKHTQRKVPIYIYQGEDDKIVSVNYSRKEVLELRSFFSISITTYPGLGHDFSPQMKRDYAALMKTYLK
jgi:phospholipase/carboxylesterase